MKTINTSEYSINLPDAFPQVKQFGNIIKAETFPLRPGEQLPAMISIHLANEAGITDRSGFLAQKVKTFMENSWATMVVTEETVPVNGMECVLYRLASEKENEHMPRMFYCLALFFTNNQQLLQMRCECEWHFREHYELFFLSSVHSVLFQGNDVQAAVREDEALVKAVWTDLINKIEAGRQPSIDGTVAIPDGWTVGRKDHFQVAYPSTFSEVLNLPNSLNVTKPVLEPGEAAEASLDLGRWSFSKMAVVTGNREQDLKEDFLAGLTTDTDTSRDDCELLYTKHLEVQGMAAMETAWRITYRDWADRFKDREPLLYYRRFDIFSSDGEHYFYLSLCCDEQFKNQYAPLMETLVNTFRATGN